MEHQITIVIDHEGIRMNTELQRWKNNRRVMISREHDGTYAIFGREFLQKLHWNINTHGSQKDRHVLRLREKTSSVHCGVRSFTYMLRWIENRLSDGYHQINRLENRRRV